MAENASRIIADYMIRDMKLPARRTDVVLLVTERPEENWGFDVAYINEGGKDVWG